MTPPRTLHVRPVADLERIPSRRRVGFWAAWILACARSAALGQGLPDAEDEEAPLRPAIQLTTTTPYLGQAIEVRVGVVAGAEPPRVSPPRNGDLAIVPIGTDLRQVASSAIGDFVDEKVRHIARFRVVPLRAGPVDLPPFTVELGERTARTTLVRLRVVTPPAEGRPRAFLGGVGAFELGAEVVPAVVRVGGTLEYRLNVSGPGALGAAGAPDFSTAVRPVPLGLEVESTAVDLVAEPPRRVYRVRLRPTRPGQGSIPPLIVAAFDPKTNRYASKASPAVPIRVEAVASFDPAALSYRGPDPVASDRIRPDRLAGLVALAVAAGVAAGLAVHRQEERIAAVRAWSRRWSGPFAVQTGPERLARSIGEALADYLMVVCGRPGGVLTPEEARAGIAQATGRADLAGRAAGLLAACDRVLYGSGTVPDAEELAAEASGVVRDLSRARAAWRSEKAVGVAAGG